MAGIVDVQTVADRQEITDLIYRYCRSMDRMDHELGYSIWNEGAMADYGDFYKGTGRGFIDHVCEAHKNALHHSHQVSNIIIELNGDRAASESYVTASLRAVRDEKLIQMTAYSRYIDHWSRHDGRWGIDSRVTIMDFDEIREVRAMSSQTAGSRDRNDPSYAALRD